MPPDPDLIARFRKTLGDTPGFSEKRMMGGLCFFLHGNMVGGLDKTKDGRDRFMFRVGKDNEREALSRPGASIMMQGGRRMGGLVFVDAAVCDDEAIAAWVALSLSFVSALPGK